MSCKMTRSNVPLLLVAVLGFLLIEPASGKLIDQLHIRRRPISNPREGHGFLGDALIRFVESAKAFAWNSKDGVVEKSVNATLSALPEAATARTPDLQSQNSALRTPGSDVAGSTVDTNARYSSGMLSGRAGTVRPVRRIKWEKMGTYLRSLLQVLVCNVKSADGFVQEAVNKLKKFEASEQRPSFTYLGGLAEL